MQFAIGCSGLRTGGMGSAENEFGMLIGPVHRYDKSMPPRSLTCAVLLFAGGISWAQSPATLPATRSATSPATQPATSPALSPERAQEILSGLSDDNFRRREAAQQMLVDLGEDAAPVIVELLRTATDTEARSRLQSALEQIEENRITGASMITIHADHASPKDVFQQLSRQCHAELRPFPENLFDQGKWSPITLQIEHQPFWDALRQISEATGVDMQPVGDGPRIARGTGFRLHGPSIVRGAFLIVATQISRSQTIALAQPRAAQSDFSLQMMVYAEPKIRVLGHSATVRLDEAVDDKGHSLLPDAIAPGGFYGGGNGMWNLYAPLKYPTDHAGTRIAIVRGNSDFVVQTHSDRLDVENPLTVHDLSRNVGGLTVNLYEMKKNGSNYEVRVSITRDPADSRWGYIQQNINQRLKVYDHAGELMEYRGMSSRAHNSMMEFTLTLATSPRGGGEPARLVWEIPTASKHLSVPFEFKDLPMPK